MAGQKTAMGNSEGTVLQIGASDNKTNDKQPILPLSSFSCQRAVVPQSDNQFPCARCLYHPDLHPTALALLAVKLPHINAQPRV